MNIDGEGGKAREESNHLYYRTIRSFHQKEKSSMYYIIYIKKDEGYTHSIIHTHKQHSFVLCYTHEQ